MPPKISVENLIERYEQLEGIELRASTAHPDLRDAFDDACKLSEAHVDELCNDPAIYPLLREAREEYDKLQADVSFLGGIALLDSDKQTEISRKAEDAAQSPLTRIALRFLEEAPITLEQNDDRGIEFFKRPPEVVATQLIGKQLRVNNVVLTITDTLPQDAKYNEKWADDPIFRKVDRADAMVGFSRGHILYLRAGDDKNPLNCVRITAAMNRNGRSNYTKAREVTKALKLMRRQTATITYDGQTISLHDFENIER